MPRPVHVAAGWLVPTAKLGELEAIVAALKQRGSTVAEVKGASLAKRPGGQRKIARFIDQMHEIDARMFFVFMEKRFSIAGRMIDAMLDPFHNEAADWLPTSLIQTRRRLTNELADVLTAELLEDFAKGYREPSEQFFHEIALRTASELEAASADRRLVDSFHGASASAAAIAEAETYDFLDHGHRDWASLNVPAFMHLVRRVDAYLDGVPGRVAIVHDETAQFQEPLRQAVEMVRQPGAGRVDVALEGGMTMRGLLRNVQSIDFANGKSLAGLQAADVLAASIFRIACDYGNGVAKETPEFLGVVHRTVPLLLNPAEGEAPPFAGLYAHERTVNALMGALFRER